MTNGELIARLSATDPNGFTREHEDAVLAQIMASPRTPGGTSPVSGARRSRRALTLVAAGVVVVGAVAAGLVISGRNTAVSAQTIARRTIKALDAASSNQIEYLQSSNPSQNPATTYDTWVYGNSVRRETLNASGSSETDESGQWTTTTCTVSAVVVNYSAQDWFNTGETQGRGLDLSPNTWTQVEANMKSGLLTVVGQPTIDGQPTIELSIGHVAQSPLASQFAQGVLPGQSSSPDKPTPHVSENLWVNATTDLPVQFVVMTGGTMTNRETVAWLPATSANRALLNAPVPSGFTQATSPAPISGFSGCGPAHE